MTQIYGLTCPATGEVMYVGKADDHQARLKSHLRDAIRRSTPVYVWIRGLIDSGTRPGIVHLCDSIGDRWQDLERQIIAQYTSDGFKLLNVAAGGNEPFCPKTVRRANGSAVAASRNKDRWALLRRLGAEAKWFKDRGDSERESKMLACMAITRMLGDAELRRLAGKFCS